MEAIIGKYRVRMEESYLILTHDTRVSFDLTLNEALWLMEFIRLYQGATATAQRDSETDDEQEVDLDEQSRSDSVQTRE